jgi:hypothetical protein
MKFKKKIFYIMEELMKELERRGLSKVLDQYTQ